MSITPAELQQVERRPKQECPDERIVRECLAGSEGAWSELIDRYKNLIYSIPLKYGFSRDDAADIFQEVCIGLVSQLATVKDPKALPKWLMQVTAHKCFHWNNKAKRTTLLEDGVEDAPEFQAPPEVVEIMRQSEQEQAIREAIGRMPDRCQRLVQMLFFEDPPRPYREVASDLGVAIGSIGLFRQSCIQQLRKALSEIGVQSIDKI
jgi:RNA polymerase sigma factor (sigma-70 family)